MKYDLKIGDNEASVDASPLDDQSTTTITLDGTARELRITALPPHRVQLTWSGRGKQLFVARCDEGTWVWSDGQARLVVDAAAQKSTRRDSGGDIGSEVTPPMPALVLEVLTKVGDAVEKGARLVVVSAMKMETTLVAPYAGTVTAVNTETGAKVAPGDILVEIDKAEEADEDGGSHE